MISHHMLNKFTVDKKMKSSLLSQNNNDNESQINNLQADRKVVRTSKKNILKIIKSSAEEKEDAILLKMKKSYKKFFMNFIN